MAIMLGFVRENTFPENYWQTDVVEGRDKGGQGGATKRGGAISR